MPNQIFIVKRKNKEIKNRKSKISVSLYPKMQAKSDDINE